MFIYSLDDIPENSNICIYGKGSRASDFINFINIFRKDIKIVCSIDSAGLNDFLKMSKEYDFIVVASVFWLEIKRILDNKKINNYKILSNDLAGSIQGYLNYKEITEKYSDNIPKILDMFELEQHKKLYKLVYDYHTNNAPIGKIIQYCIENMNHVKNHYIEFAVKDKIETYIDGGVFDGTTTSKLIKEFKNIKNVFGFEPLKEKLNFNYAEFIDTEKYSRFEIYSKGLWYKSEILGFNVSDVASAIAETSTAQDSIETISIDEFVEKYNVPKIDFIKMDVENAELNALKGGLKTILKDRPQLAISIYHSLEQFVEIPLFLKSTLENYSYYLGHYSCSKYETVLYAIPKELEEKDN